MTTTMSQFQASKSISSTSVAYLSFKFEIPFVSKKERSELWKTIEVEEEEKEERGWEWEEDILLVLFSLTKLTCWVKHSEQVRWVCLWICEICFTSWLHSHLYPNFFLFFFFSFFLFFHLLFSFAFARFKSNCDPLPGKACLCVLCYTFSVGEKSWLGSNHCVCIAYWAAWVSSWIGQF